MTRLLLPPRAASRRDRTAQTTGFVGERAVLAGVLAVAAATRILVLLQDFSWLDGDEAVTGIMAQRIARGDLVAYFGGNGYLGAGEQYLQAPLAALSPTDPFLLRLPQVALSVLSCYLVYRLGCRLLEDRRVALCAAAWFAVGPFFCVVYGTKSKVGAAPLLLGLAGFLLATGMPDARVPAWGRHLAFGLCAGLGFWLNWSCALVLLPAGWWLLGVVRARLKPLATVAAGFLAGSSPFWWTVAAGRIPVFTSGTTRPSAVSERADALFGPVLGMFLGVRLAPPAGAADPAFRWAPPALAVAAAVAVLGAAVWQRRRGLLAIAGLRPQAARPLDLVVLAFAVTPLPYVAGSFSWQTVDPRYLFPLYGLLPLAAGGLVEALTHARRAWRVPVAVLAAVALAATTLAAGARARAGDAANDAVAVRPAALAAVVDVLAAQGETSVWAGYWIAYPLQFAAPERLAVASFHDPHFLDTEAVVRRDPSPAIVSFRHLAHETEAALRAAGASFRRRDVATFSVFTGIDPGLQPAGRGAGALQARLRRADAARPPG